MNIELDSNDDTIDRVATVTFPNHTFAARRLGDLPARRRSAGADHGGRDHGRGHHGGRDHGRGNHRGDDDRPRNDGGAHHGGADHGGTDHRAATTVAPSTTTTTIVIPVAPTDSLWDIIEREEELSEFEQFVIDAGFQDELDDPTRIFTIFAPTNDAIDAANEVPADSLPTDPGDLNDLLLAHASDIDPAPELADLLEDDLDRRAVRRASTDRVRTSAGARHDR